MKPIEQYVAARDLDGMPMRCPSPFQEAYREVAARHGCILIDGQSYFHAIGRHGLLDDELFQDAMHPSLRGQIALAQAVLVRSTRGTRLDGRRIRPYRSLTRPNVSRILASTRAPGDRIALWWKGFNELMSPLRYDTNLRLRKREAGIAAAAKIDAGVAPEAVGLPNVGIPAGIPLIVKKLEPMPSPTQTVMPCLTQ